MADDNEPQVERSAEQARAGATPGMTRYILVISLVLIVVLFAALLLFQG